jgi:hypothetical protein
MLRNLMLGIKVFRRHTIHRFGAAGAGDSIRRSALQMCRRCCMQFPSCVLRCLGSIDLVRSVGASGVHCRAGTHAQTTHACTEARIRRMRACVRACSHIHTHTLLKHCFLGLFSLLSSLNSCFCTAGQVVSVNKSSQLFVSFWVY